MKTKKILSHLITFLIALVWLVNGLFCKLLNLVPRHQEIVGRLLGHDHAALFTKCIGVGEVLMAVWIISGIKTRWCTVAQILLVGTMNIIEFLGAPDLLLFGRFNLLVAIIFILVLIIKEFVYPYKEIEPSTN